MLIAKIKAYFSNKTSLVILFISWFVYSAGLLGFMALHEKTPPHCVISTNTR